MINVLKATKDKEPFSEEKLRASIKRAGIPESIQNLVINHVKTKLYDNIPTSEIYHHIKEFLGRSEHPFSQARYSLKHAIMELGPTGYPFEDYVAEILKSLGYQTATRQILDGKCIKHEVDIVATKNGVKSMIECKFHNSTGIHTQVHVPMYTKARFDDLKDKHNLNDAWLVTNTRITSDALNFAICSNIKVISWNYPENQGLRDLIEKAQLHPITALTTLSQNDKQNLLDNRTVLCRDVLNKPETLQDLNLSVDKKRSILEEAQYACRI
jgi:hypothetical protein